MAKVGKKEVQTIREGKIALLGYSDEAMAAAKALGYAFVSVVPPGFETHLIKDGIEAVVWEFDKHNEGSNKLLAELQARGCRLAIPLYEECVEWAGTLNSTFLNDPRRFAKVMLLRDKAMMKRKAQMSGIRVGAFEEVEGPDDLRKFFQRINEAQALIEGDKPEPVHVKPMRAAGSVGHQIIRTLADVIKVPLEAYPLLAESHLGGQEFSCEAFIHHGKIAFMNINEYVHLGYTQFSPPGPVLEALRPKIREQVEKLIRAFDIRYGVIHPEYFLDVDGELAFGEVANRVPGGHIFELIQRVYGFDPFQALILCSDNQVTEAEFNAFLPDEVEGRTGHAGNCLVFPKKQWVHGLNVPDDLLAHPFYEKHSMYEPIAHKVLDRTGYGNHYGTIFFFGDDPDELKRTLQKYEATDFYT